MSSLPRPPPALILNAAVASPSLSTTLLLALATALVLPLLLVALAASVSALWKAIKAELAPVQQAPAAPPRRSKKTSLSKPPRASIAGSAAAGGEARCRCCCCCSAFASVGAREARPPGAGDHARPRRPHAPGPRLGPADAQPSRGRGAVPRRADGRERRRGVCCTEADGGRRRSRFDVELVGVDDESFSIPPLLGAGAAHPNVAQLFAVRESLVAGGCNAASGALLPPARRGCGGRGPPSRLGCAGSRSPSSSSAAAALSAPAADGRPLSLAAALAAAGAPLPDTSLPPFSPSSSSSVQPEIETVAVYEFCERGTLRDAIRAWAATAAAAKSRRGGGGGGGGGGPARLTPFDPSISPAPPADDAHLRVKTLLEVARGLARVHGAGGRPHGALCAENVVLAASDADRRGFVAKLAAFSRPPSAGVGAGVGAWGAAPPGLAPELAEAARVGSGGGMGGGGLATLSASELRRRRRLASTSSAEDIDEEVEFSAPLPPWAAPLGASAAEAAARNARTATAVPTASFEADVFAFGVLAWEVAASADAGLLPPPLPTAAARNAGEEEALLASWPCCRALGSLATQCLSPQPRARPSVAQLLRSLAALEERLRADTARSELDYLFAAVNARQAPISSSSSSLKPNAPVFEPTVVPAAAPVAAAVAAAAAAAAASCVDKGTGGEIEWAEGAVARSAPRAAPALSAAAAAGPFFFVEALYGGHLLRHAQPADVKRASEVSQHAPLPPPPPPPNRERQIFQKKRIEAEK